MHVHDVDSDYQPPGGNDVSVLLCHCPPPGGSDVSVLPVRGVDADLITVHHQVAMMCLCCLFTVLMLTLGVTSLGGRWMFMLWVGLLFLAFSGSFSLMPTATARSFGHAHYPRNYGLVFTCEVR